ncbi:MAG: hypothetical protein ACPGWR_28460 [Ardenticatenaceae bacterium]
MLVLPIVNLLDNRGTDPSLPGGALSLDPPELVEGSKGRRAGGMLVLPILNSPDDFNHKSHDLQSRG